MTLPLHISDSSW
uniref:Uncharacterized protein n=1 Tax=Anguilla anguilla TaxID=7936 RepID=A0A0E9PSI1_ANGAN